MNSLDSGLLHVIFSAVAESYTSIVYMDPTDRMAYPVRLDDYSERYRSVLENGILMSEIVKIYAKEGVCPEDAPELERLADYDYVSKRLSEEKQILHIYRTIHNENIVYYRLKIVSIEDGKKIIYGFENIDHEYRKQMEVQSERELQMMFLKGLSREYMSVWYLDGASRKVRLIQNNGTDNQNGEAVRIGNTLIDYHFSMQKYFGKYVDPEEFDRMMNATAYETLAEKTTENDLYRINYIRINPDGSRSHFQVCYAKITDEKGIANFVFGYRCTDSAIEE